MSALAASLSRAVNAALAHLERGRISEAQVVLHNAQELVEAELLANLEVARLLGALPTVTPPACPVGQRDEE
jgi:hypothetical protein